MDSRETGFIQTYLLNGKRDGYMDGKWSKFDEGEMDLPEAGNRVDGPVIIEHRLISSSPPENGIGFDERRFIWYKKK